MKNHEISTLRPQKSAEFTDSIKIQSIQTGNHPNPVIFQWKSSKSVISLSLLAKVKVENHQNLTENHHISIILGQKPSKFIEIGKIQSETIKVPSFSGRKHGNPVISHWKIIKIHDGGRWPRRKISEIREIHDLSGQNEPKITIRMTEISNNGGQNRPPRPVPAAIHKTPFFTLFAPLHHTAHIVIDTTNHIQSQ